MLRILDVGEPLTFGTEELDLTLLLSPPKVRLTRWQRLLKWVHGLYKRSVIRGTENWRVGDSRTGFYNGGQLS